MNIKSNCLKIYHAVVFSLEKIKILLDKCLKLVENNGEVIFCLYTKGNIELHEWVERKRMEHITPFAVNIVK